MNCGAVWYVLLAAIPVTGCSEDAALMARSPSQGVASDVAGGTGDNVVRLVVNEIGMEFAMIGAGQFQMGRPDTNKDNPIPPGFVPHRVRISRPFYVGVHEVTQEQFEHVMGTNPSWHSARGGGGEDLTEDDTSRYPVENVTWEEANGFCLKLSEAPEEKRSGHSYRLPTEAEWEYACRERTSRPYHFRVGKDLVAGENAGKKEKEETLPITTVGSYPPNSLGLYDMRGNVWEWCGDWFSPDYYERSPRDDPQGPERGMFRIVRGSDWVFVGPVCNYPRDPLEPWRRSRWVGFRVVCDVNK